MKLETINLFKKIFKSFLSGKDVEKEEVLTAYEHIVRYEAIAEKYPSAKVTNEPSGVIVTKKEVNNTKIKQLTSTSSPNIKSIKESLGWAKYVLIHRAIVKKESGSGRLQRMFPKLKILLTEYVGATSGKKYAQKSINGYFNRCEKTFMDKLKTKGQVPVSVMNYNIEDFLMPELFKDFKHGKIFIHENIKDQERETKNKGFNVNDGGVYVYRDINGVVKYIGHSGQIGKRFHKESGHHVKELYGKTIDFYRLYENTGYKSHASNSHKFERLILMEGILIATMSMINFINGDERLINRKDTLTRTRYNEDKNERWLPDLNKYIKGKNPVI
jgi:hypothetical protein